jgi:hypothetical protein
MATGADVSVKARAANQIKNGSVTVFCAPSGYIRPNDPRVQTRSNMDSVEDRLSTRFDDPTYYDA